MPDPTSIATGVLSCIGISHSVSVPSRTVPALPNVPAVTIPGLNFAFAWPDLNKPGFPGLTVGFAGSMLAGLNYVQKYIPPNPNNLPSLPTIDLFVGGFMGSAMGQPKMPASSIAVPGVPNIPFPGFPGTEIPGLNSANSILKFIGLFIGVPFLIFTGIVKSILNLSLQIPGVSQIASLLTSTSAGLGLPAQQMGVVIPCLAKGASSILSGL